MSRKKFLNNFAKIANIHADRLSYALQQIGKLIPISEEKLESLGNENISNLDMLTTRFSKLQDIIGAKIFPLILESLAEDEVSFIDKLNKLEKLGYLDSANWWLEIREIRNKITHDYPDNYAKLAEHLNAFVPQGEKLLSYWKNLKLKLAKL